MTNPTLLDQAVREVTLPIARQWMLEDVIRGCPLETAWPGLVWAIKDRYRQIAEEAK